ncbi:unknown [Tropheryma whipplei str. Twist]|uniref:Uncharacterized protein n=1 Tax=Tropheryma whipplei (strain Twist) TaxID=203267 RepID=Q83FU4_TROWT|nr:unknown [Tropheryma whipplei str. Twist]
MLLRNLRYRLGHRLCHLVGRPRCLWVIVGGSLFLLIVFSKIRRENIQQNKICRNYQ